LANPPASSTCSPLRQNDPTFRQALLDADEEAKDMIFEEIRRRALEGISEGVYQAGSRVFEPVTDSDDKVVRDESGEVVMRPASITRYDSRLLLRLASRLDPNWSERTIHEHSGQIEHRVATMAEMQDMSPEELATIDRALDLVSGKKKLEHRPELPVIEVVDEEADTLAVLDALEETDG